MTVKFFALFVFFQLAGCSYLPHFLYKIDVQQGNVVTEEMVEKLKPGMTRSQVRFVMGSPLIVDTFRDNRWDYVYIFREHGDLIEQKRLTIFFEGDELLRIENYMIFPSKPNEPKPDKAKVESETTQPDSEKK